MKIDEKTHTTILIVVYGVIICCIIIFLLTKKLAQMLNKPKNKEYGFRCQTWQTRCKRNKAAVDKAFMPHSGKQP
ncbi:hypothetical protein SEEH1514_10390 [Salmonella enterica subsp. enterica serovar Heidelberg str. N1514]|nr:hypothetical protein SEEH1514_10390 [Salmonella enterica subsp. enterica serovar Heidelberg str. N1514]